LHAPARKTLSVNTISELTYMLPEDIVTALREMKVLNAKKRTDGMAVVNKVKVREWAEKNKVDLESYVEAKDFVELPELEEDGDVELEE
jgi:hypothetical protein